jgi:lipoprotein-releasing system permease protein
MGIIVIALGVSFFILTQAQTRGFEEFFIKTILGTNGAIRISDKYQNSRDYVEEVASNNERHGSWRPTERTYIEGVDYPNALMKQLRPVSGISGISEIVEGGADLTLGGKTYHVRMNGIRLYDHLRVSSLAGQIVSGDLSSFETNSLPILVGERLAHRMDLKVGQKVMLHVGDQNTQAQIVAIFQTGSGDIDLERVYLPINQVRTLLKKPFGNSILQIGMDNPADAPALAKSIEDSFHYHAVCWQEREKVWLDVFAALRVSSAITVCSILVIAAMGIFNTLTMMVLEKTRQIAILMAMGYSTADIRSIFLWQGVFLGSVGCVLGVALGALGTFMVEKLPIKIRGIFSTDHFVVSWNTSHYVLAVVLALIAVFVATIAPALRAAKLQPADVLRGGSL